jgi:hypothetical protein
MNVNAQLSDNFTDKEIGGRPGLSGLLSITPAKVFGNSEGDTLG